MAKPIRSPEGLANQKAKAQERHRRNRLDPAYRAKEALKAKERYHRNKEKYREISLKWRDRNREVVCEKRRRWRRDNPDSAREGDKRCRESSIKYAIARIRDGSMGLSELNQRINRALIRVNDRTKSHRSRGSDDCDRGSKADPKPNEASAGCLQDKKGS